MFSLKKRNLMLCLVAVQSLWIYSTTSLAGRPADDRFVVSEPDQIVSAKKYKNFVFNDGTWYYARKVSFTVRNENCASANFEVSVNGDRKMGYDLSHCDQDEKTYTINVNETTNSLGIRVSNGSIVVKEIVVEGYRHDGWDECLYDSPCPSPRPRVRPPRGDSIMNPSRSPITRLVRQVIDIVDELRPLTMYADYGDYLLPVKLHAGKLEPLSRSRGSLSEELRESVEVLIRQIDAAEEYFEDAATADRQYELILDLREVRHLLFREFA